MKILSEYVWEKNERRENEDSVGLRQYHYLNKICSIALVCDGIGGLKQGETASSFVVYEMFSAMEKLMKKGKLTKRHIRNSFFRAICQAHEKLIKYGERERVRLGTTMSMAVIIGHRGYLFHVGDSGIYMGKRRLVLVTKRHQRGSKLLRALGAGHYHNPDFKTFYFRKNMTLLLCTDGFDRKTPDGIEGMALDFLDEEAMKRKLHQIAHMAKLRGEKDNMSAVMIKNVNQ